jgi:hypothetical protein
MGGKRAKRLADFWAGYVLGVKKYTGAESVNTEARIPHVLPKGINTQAREFSGAVRRRNTRLLGEADQVRPACMQNS